MKSRDSQQIPCAVCGDEDHGGKLFSCKTFRRANLEEKKAQVKMAKACTKCLDVHGVDGACTPRFLCRKEKCKKGDTPVHHHYFLCPKAPTKKDAAKRENKTEEKEGTSWSDSGARGCFCRVRTDSPPVGGCPQSLY